MSETQVKPGERWRMQVLSMPYMCPFLGENGTMFEKVKHAFLGFDPNHLVDGKLPDGCCYMDVEIVETNDHVIILKVFGDDLEDTNTYSLLEVLNDDRIARFYRV